VAYARRQIRLARELWDATAKRDLPAGDDFTVYRRNLQRGFNAVGASAPLLARQIGGVSTTRALAGSNQPVFQVVDAARQRSALDALLSDVLASNSFRFDPAFISRLGIDHVDRLSPGKFVPQTDFSLAGAIMGIQRPLLDALMSDGLAARIADNEPKVAKPGDMPSYAEVQSKLSAAVWSELRGPRAVEIDSLRRNLQREHAKRLAGGVLRAGSNAAADVRAVHRQEALGLEAALKKALALGGWSPMARAHLADTLNVLGEALRAPLMRQGV
jgi:Met-zincin